MNAVSNKASLVAEYRRLLSSDWKRSFPDDVLALLWATVGDRVSANGDAALADLLNPRSTRPLPQQYCGALIERIANASSFLNLFDLPSLPEDYVPPARPGKPAAQAIRLAVHLTLHAHLDLSGDTGFFRDVQALGFQAAVHYVLPDLRDKHPGEHALLLQALGLFAAACETADAAQASYLRSLVQGALGRTEERLEALLASVRLTPPDDHSYLTKAQEYWSELLDLERHGDAEEFLFTLHWQSLPEQRDEIRAMIVDAIQYAAKGGKSKSRFAR